MGWFGDLADEWKKASTGEKIMIGGGVIGVIAIALYLRNQSQQAQPNTAATGAGLNGGVGGGGGGIQTVPGPNGSQLPILPGGLCQQFDQQGNLTGYTPCNPAPPTPPTPPSGGTKPPPSGTCPKGTQMCNGKCQPMGLSCRNEINPHHAPNKTPGQRPVKETHHASSATIVPSRAQQRTPPIIRHTPPRQHTTVAHVASQRHTPRANQKVIFQQTQPWSSSPGTINPFPG